MSGNLAVQSELTSPASVNMKFYRFYAGVHDDCMDTSVITDYGANGVVKDLTFDPIIFSGMPASIEYRCIGVEMEDVVTFRPNSSAIASWPTVCTDQTMEYTADIYRSDDSLAWRDIRGQAIPARGTQLVPVQDRMLFLASTTPVRVTSGTLSAATSQVALLSKVVEAPTSLVFFADFSGKVSASSSLCHLENPVFGFR
jgi:hypothetical protein